MNSVDQKRFDIQDFEISGGTRETFIIQKKIQRFSNKKSENKIKLIIDLKKNETIKEKNIRYLYKGISENLNSGDPETQLF